MSIDFGTMKETQREKVRKLLWDCKWHSYKELNKVGGIRYSARLLELKRLGFEIRTGGVEPFSGAKYRLVSREPGEPQGKQVKVLLDSKDAYALLEGPLPSKKAREAISKAFNSFMANKEKL